VPRVVFGLLTDAPVGLNSTSRTGRLRLISFSMLASISSSDGLTSEIASPSMPARPVRPIRCT
jgi:hypothetical protein